MPHILLFYLVYAGLVYAITLQATQPQIPTRTSQYTQLPVQWQCYRLDSVAECYYRCTDSYRMVCVCLPGAKLKTHQRSTSNKTVERSGRVTAATLTHALTRDGVPPLIFLFYPES